jgi:hypothetical protein
MSKRKRLQKPHERFLLERFFEAAELHAEIVEEREAPDFLVHLEDRFIGVELTELFISHDVNFKSLQAQESISARIITRARELYEESGGSPAHVSVCFGPGFDLHRLHRERTAAALAAYVRCQNLTAWHRVDWRPEEIAGPLPYEISFIHALGVPSVEMAHWSVPRAGWVASLTAGALQTRIDEKARRLPAYLEAVRENWLVLVADRTKPSQLFDNGEGLDAGAVTSPFSRSFFYGYPERTVIELGV